MLSPSLAYRSNSIFYLPKEIGYIRHVNNLKENKTFIRIYNYHKKRPEVSVVTNALSSLYPWVLGVRYNQDSVGIPYTILVTTDYTILNLIINF